jgi:phage shock protein A
MILDEPIRDTQQSLAGLRQAAADAHGWSDEIRRRFDAQRLEPLAKAGNQLLQALTRAQQEHQEALSLLPV